MQAFIISRSGHKAKSLIEGEKEKALRLKSWHFLCLEHPGVREGVSSTFIYFPPPPCVFKKIISSFGEWKTGLSSMPLLITQATQ